MYWNGWKAKIKYHDEHNQLPPTHILRLNLDRAESIGALQLLILVLVRQSHVELILPPRRVSIFNTFIWGLSPLRWSICSSILQFYWAGPRTEYLILRPLLCLFFRLDHSLQVLGWKKILEHTAWPRHYLSPE